MSIEEKKLLADIKEAILSIDEHFEGGGFLQNLLPIKQNAVQ